MVNVTDPAPRLRVAIIGTGRVGSVLGAALARVGHRIVAASGLSDISQRRAAQMLPDVPLLSPDLAVPQADLVVLAVPDDQLVGLVAGLAATGCWRAGQIAFHTCGAHGLAPLQPAVNQAVVGLAIHPVMTFAGYPEDLQRLAGTVFGVTAEPGFRPVAETLVYELGGEPVWIPDQARPRYHAALALGANYLTTLVNDATDLLETAGVGDPRVLLAPLLNAALDNALRLRDAALTGPIARGDSATVATHLRALAGSEARGTYIALGRRTVARAQAAGQLTQQQAHQLYQLLAADEAGDGPPTAGQQPGAGDGH